MKVVHLMRTYGVHGGEQQLSQLFGANQNLDIQEIFAFVFRDAECTALFAQRAPRLAQTTLSGQAHQTGTAWREFLRLLPRLPLLQWRFWQLLRREQAEVCVAHGFQAALVAWPVACLHRKAGYAYVHRTTKGASRFGWVFRCLYRPFQVVAGNSYAVTRSLAPYADASRLAALDNGIDLEKFDRGRQEPSSDRISANDGEVLIAVGRLLPRKGQDLLIDALALMLPAHPRLKLWIIGDGVSRAYLEQKVGSLGLHASVVFFGQRADVPALLARASLFVNASSWEGMSNAVLEGMAAGLASVVADAPGVSECHIDGETGLVVERSAQALAAAMAQLLTERERAQAMGRAARRRVQSVYSIEASRRRYDALYDRLKGR